MWSFVVTFLDTFWHPWGQGGHPGRSLGVPLGTLCITFASIFAVSAPWLLLLLPGVPSRSPPGVEMWLKHSKYRCFAKVRILSPRCQKGVPGVPRDLFWALCWHLLEHLGVPFAPRGHFEATLSHTCLPTDVFMHFGWILVSPGPPKKKSAARAERMPHCGKSTLWHLKRVFYLGFSTFGTRLRLVGSI